MQNFEHDEMCRKQPPLPPFRESRDDPYDPFFIPRDILFGLASLESESDQSGCALLRLPPEILAMIFRHVRIPYFQVCLALTSKAMGRIGMAVGSMSPWRGYRDKDGLFRLLGRQPKSIIPASLTVCRACFRFRPRDLEYWMNKFESLAKMSESDDPLARTLDLDINYFTTTAASTTGYYSCPDCASRHYANYLSEGLYYKDRANPPIGPDGRRVCPELHSRMDRP